MTLKVAPGPPGPWRCVASLVAGRVATTLGDGLSLLVGREVSYGRDALPTPPRLRRAAHRRWLPIPDHLLPPGHPVPRWRLARGVPALPLVLVRDGTASESLIAEFHIAVRIAFIQMSLLARLTPPAAFFKL